ncbi:unnamed protein product [Sympodiomycopsis kandeliae]
MKSSPRPGDYQTYPCRTRSKRQWTGVDSASLADLIQPHEAMRDIMNQHLSNRDSPIKRTIKKATRSKGPSCVVENQSFTANNFPEDKLKGVIFKIQLQGQSRSRCNASLSRPQS